MEIESPAVEIEVTERQFEIFRYIEGFIFEHGYPPTRREIASHFNFGVNAAVKHLDALIKAGAIEITPGVSRGISLLAEVA